MDRVSAMISLQHLGDLRSGYVAREGLVECGRQGGTRALQARDVAPDGSIAWPALRCVNAVSNAQRYAVRDGDLLVPLRAARIVAIAVHDVQEAVIAVGHWGILTPDPLRADADYLAWYLNHPATAARLRGVMSGSSLLFLPVGALRDFEVDVPPLDVQRRIAHVDALHARVVELEAQLGEARRQLVNEITLAALRSGPNSVRENG